MGRGHNVQTVDRAARILRLFSSERPEWGVSEVARALGMSKSSVSSVMSTLAGHGLLSRTRGRRYRLGWQVLALSETLLRTTAFKDHARRAMEHLAYQYGELLHLAAFNGSQVVYVEKVGGTRSMRVPITATGATLPAHSSGVGKVLLAHRSWEEVSAIVERRGLPALTPNTITAPDKLRSELENVRARGYAYDIEETMPSLSCVAAPIRNNADEVVAAVSFSVPAYRFLQGEERYRTAIVETARSIA